PRRVRRRRGAGCRRSARGRPSPRTCPDQSPERPGAGTGRLRGRGQRPATKEFAASTQGRLKLFFLPGYSPELNPDEWVWKNVKHDRIGKTGVTSKQDLKAKAIGALRRLQKRPGLVRAFFADPHLRYITA
ncbi:MAG TPA: transposase, partial [Streptosporangiaceae bacterium]